MNTYYNNEYENVGNDADEDLLLPNDRFSFKKLKEDPKLEKEVKKITSILEKREKSASRAGHFVHKANRFAGVTGVVLATLPFPAIGVPLVITSLAVHFINQSITQNAEHKFEHAHWALNIFKDRNVIDEHTNQTACDALHETERYVRYFENGRSILGTVLKFGLGRVGSAFESIGKVIEYAMMFDEGREGLIKHLGKEKEIPSVGMRRGIYNIEEHLKIPHPAHKQSLQEKFTDQVNKVFPERMARIVIRPE